jgi:hypothetical protein
MNQQKFITFCFFLYILSTVKKYFLKNRAQRRKHQIRIFEARGLISLDNINLVYVKHLSD